MPLPAKSVERCNLEPLAEASLRRARNDQKPFSPFIGELATDFERLISGFRRLDRTRSICIDACDASSVPIRPNHANLAAQVLTHPVPDLRSRRVVKIEWPW
jgi:hypothetical protein